MRKLLFGFLAVLACTALVATDADAARRLGGGRSIGAQRSVTSAPPAAAPAKPAQQAAPASQPATQPAAQPQPASGFARWAPLLGGFALGWLMGANGMGGLMVGLLLSGLLVFAAIALVRMLTQRRGDALPRIQYAGIGSETVAAPPPSQAIGFEAQPAHVSNANIPDGFDVAGFLKGAKLNYMRLQIANDQGNLDELREYTTDELFEELKRDVLALNADLLEVVTEGDKHWASIRFSGSLREAPGEAPQGFEEVWNLAKPLSGGGWQLAGIQQMH